MIRTVLRFLASVLLYVGIVIGGVTLFLILAPVFGYLPYSDRPGAGWFGRFPAVGWSEFWPHALGMLEFGAFFAIMFLIPGVICVGVIRAMEHSGYRSALIRIVGAVLGAALSGYWMLGAGWYISASLPVFWIALVCGLAAGGWILPRRARRHGDRVEIGRARSSPG